MRARAACHPDRQLKAHGLCGSCYNRHLYLGQRPQATNRRDFNTARLENLTWMHDTGETAERAAARLGISLTALEKWCSRHDAGHLFQTMHHRQNPTRQEVA